MQSIGLPGADVKQPVSGGESGARRARSRPRLPGGTSRASRRP